jgi:hypothetical protein
MSFALTTRRTSVLALISCLALAALASPAFASEVIVPDNYPTITLAIASGADTVSVRQGTYPESLAIARSLVLRGLGPDGPSPGGYPSFEQPVVTAVTTVMGVMGSFDTGLTLLDFHVLHASRMSAMISSSLVRGCRFDAGLDARGGSERADVQYCRLSGNINIGGRLSDIGMNQVTAGTLWLGDAFGPVTAHDNVVVGPAATGMIVGEDVFASNNHVSGCTVGIAFGASVSLTGNVVEDCSGTGYRGGPSSGGTSYSMVQNTARRCGGRGFYVQTTVGGFTGNVVDSTGQEGVVLPWGALDMRDNVVLRAGGSGIVVAAIFRGRLSGNRVIGAGGDGIVVQASADTITGNVVGRSQGRGIVVEGGSGRGCHLNHNTAFLNGGAGLSMTNPYAAELDSINNNLSVGNAVGLEWSAAYAPVLACNDWFGNTASVIGTAPSAADTALDPLFCAVAANDVSLAGNSPLVNLAGCGSVGALGVGCAVPVAVGPNRLQPANG